MTDPSQVAPGAGAGGALRDAVAADAPAMLALNAESVHFLSPLDAEGLAALRAQACCCRVAGAPGVVHGFLLALREGAGYASPNYRWFAARYARFVYIDRIVIGAAGRGQGLGVALYEDLIGYARHAQAERVVAEFDVEPPNPASARLHERFGFREVGQQSLYGGVKRVSLQALELAGSTPR